MNWQISEFKSRIRERNWTEQGEILFKLSRPSKKNESLVLSSCAKVSSFESDAGKPVDAHISERILHLKEQVATLEKREERYKTVFADKISVFRRACCEIFGYKINMNDHQRPNGIPVTQFTLQSIYALHDDEKLKFEYESGNVTILPSDYTSQPHISRQIAMFVNKMNSIPALTANITVESFNRRTLS